MRIIKSQGRHCLISKFSSSSSSLFTSNSARDKLMKIRKNLNDFFLFFSSEHKTCRILVWGDGYYNGAIKTRKTVQPMEVSAEEASLQRSQQLRELYDALSSGDTNQQQQQARRPSASLSPEDLTESEWFYLMCVSFSFAPGVG